MQDVVILGTGGTIAGVATNPARAWAYQAGQLSVDQLVDAVPGLDAAGLRTRQVAQIDSKDMRWAVWQALAQAVREELARPDVAAVVITHGTDTLEETAWLFDALHDGGKPVVLTAAMRPATAPDADGPRNLRDAVRVARQAAAHGVGLVMAVLHGRVWAGHQVRKVNSCAIDAFGAGEAQPLAELDVAGQVHGWTCAPTTPRAARWSCLLDVAEPPRVEVVLSHADADGWLVRAMLAHQPASRPLRGLVVAGTGHGTVHQDLEAALVQAETAGVRIWRSTRVPDGGVTTREGDRWPGAGTLSIAQARLALVLNLIETGVR